MKTTFRNKIEQKMLFFENQSVSLTELCAALDTNIHFSLHAYRENTNENDQFSK